MPIGVDLEDWEVEELRREDEEARKELARRIGSEALQPMDTYISLELFRDWHRRGRRLALPYCVIFCHQRKAKLPKWAFDALAEGFEKYLQGEKLESVLFKKSRKGGRHTDPRLEQDELEHEVRIYRAVR